MTQRQIAALACKILALMALVSAFKSLPLLFSPALTPTTGLGDSARLASYVNTLPVYLDLGAATFLWLYASKLAEHMVEDGEATVAPLAVGPELQRVAFSLLGLWTLLEAIPHLGRMLASTVLVNQQSELLQREMKGIAFPDFVGVFLEIALGLWLLLGAAGLVRLLRNVGRDEPTPAVDA